MPKLLPKATALFQDSDRVRTMMGEWEQSQSKLLHDNRIGDWIGEAESVADLGCGTGRAAIGCAGRARPRPTQTRSDRPAA